MPIRDDQDLSAAVGEAVNAANAIALLILIACLLAGLAGATVMVSDSLPAEAIACMGAFLGLGVATGVAFLVLARQLRKGRRSAAIILLVLGGLFGLSGVAILIASLLFDAPGLSIVGLALTATAGLLEIALARALSALGPRVRGFEPIIPPPPPRF